VRTGLCHVDRQVDAVCAVPWSYLLYIAVDGVGLVRVRSRRLDTAKAWSVRGALRHHREESVAWRVAARGESQALNLDRLENDDSYAVEPPEIKAVGRTRNGCSDCALRTINALACRRQTGGAS